MYIWIATGGTGGHIFPAMAVADELVRRGYRITISSDARGWNIVRRSHPTNSSLSFVWASGVGAKSKLQQAISLFKIGVSAIALIFRFMIFRPDCIVAFGGYASVPAVMAARIWKIKTLLHEQNGAIGRANKFALRWVDVLMTSFPKVDGVVNRKSSELKIVYTGLPVRDSFKPSDFNHHPSSINLLITGGSLGATILDDVCPPAIVNMSSAVKKKLFVVHQTRGENVARLQKFYSENKIRANVLSFIHDMAKTITDSDLVVGRSGASTVVELQTIGRPAIFVPLGINPDQLANAQNFAALGGGIVVLQSKFTQKWLTHELSDLFENPARLVKMAEKARVPNNAVNLIVDEVIRRDKR